MSTLSRRPTPRHARGRSAPPARARANATAGVDATKPVVVEIDTPKVATSTHHAAGSARPVSSLSAPTRLTTRHRPSDLKVGASSKPEAPVLVERVTEKPAPAPAIAAGGGVARSAASNVTIALLSMVTALVVPAALLRAAPEDVVNGYLLALKVGGAFAILDLGINLTATRTMAEAVGAGHPERIHTLIERTQRIYLAIILLGSTVLSTLIIFMGQLFPDIPANRVNDTRLAVGLVGGSALIALMATPYRATLATYQQMSRVLLKTAGARVIGAGVTVVAAGFGVPIAALCAFTAATTLTIALIERTTARRYVLAKIPKPKVQFPGTAFSLWLANSAVSTVSVAQFLIGGLDVTVVGRYDFLLVPAYYAANGIVVAITGIHTAILFPAFPEIGKSLLPSQHEKFDALVSRAIATSVAFRMVALSGLAFLGPYAVALWVGNNVAKSTVPFLALLALSDSLRMGDWVYSFTVLASGNYRLMMSKAFVEGFSHLALIITLGRMYGARGIVIANVLSALIGIGWLVIVCSRRVRRAVGLKPAPFFLDALALPLALAVGMMLLGQAMPTSGVYIVVRAGLFLLTVGVAYEVAITRRIRLSATPFTEKVSHSRASTPTVGASTSGSSTSAANPQTRTIARPSSRFRPAAATRV